MTKVKKWVLDESPKSSTSGGLEKSQYRPDYDKGGINNWFVFWKLIVRVRMSATLTKPPSVPIRVRGVSQAGPSQTQKFMTNL